STTASFVEAFSKVGLVPDGGGTFFLPRLVGVARAMSLTVLAEALPAEEAVRIGLIYRAVEPDRLSTEAWELAKRLAQGPTRAIGLTKRALLSSFSHTLKEQLEVEMKLQSEAG